MGGCGEVEAVGEDRTAVQQASFVVVEQVIGPGDRTNLAIYLPDPAYRLSLAGANCPLRPASDIRRIRARSSGVISCHNRADVWRGDIAYVRGYVAAISGGLRWRD